MLKQSSLTIRLHPADDVVIARQQLVGGTTLIDEGVMIAGLVPPGHKVATRAIPVGDRGRFAARLANNCSIACWPRT